MFKQTFLSLNSTIYNMVQKSCRVKKKNNKKKNINYWSLYLGLTLLWKPTSTHSVEPRRPCSSPLHEQMTMVRRGLHPVIHGKNINYYTLSHARLCLLQVLRIRHHQIAFSENMGSLENPKLPNCVRYSFSMSCKAAQLQERKSACN